MREMIVRSLEASGKCGKTPRFIVDRTLVGQCCAIFEAFCKVSNQGWKPLIQDWCRIKRDITKLKLKIITKLQDIDVSEPSIVRIIHFEVVWERTPEKFHRFPYREMCRRLDLDHA